jgi:hypothetical protein
MLCSILLSRLTPASDEIIAENQCEFWVSSSTTDHVVCMYEVLKKKKPEYSWAVCQVFRDCMKVSVSWKREIYDILIC